MSEDKTGGPAFPSTVEHGDGSYTNYRGLTVRDYIAVHASEADIAAHRTMLHTVADNVKVASSYVSAREEARYQYADAMLAERAK